MSEPKKRRECTKCGADNSLIRGPLYDDGENSLFCSKGRECLIYTCANCGYSWDEPTMDDKEETDND